MMHKIPISLNCDLGIFYKLTTQTNALIHHICLNLLNDPIRHI